VPLCVDVCGCVFERVGFANNPAGPHQRPRCTGGQQPEFRAFSLRLRCKDAATTADRSGHRLEGGGNTATPVDSMFGPHGTVRRAGLPKPHQAPLPVWAWGWGWDRELRVPALAWSNPKTSLSTEEGVLQTQAKGDTLAGSEANHKSMIQLPARCTFIRFMVGRSFVWLLPFGWMVLARSTRRDGAGWSCQDVHVDGGWEGTQEQCKDFFWGQFFFFFWLVGTIPRCGSAYPPPSPRPLTAAGAYTVDVKDSAVVGTRVRLQALCGLV
jgi:hypothetical protein